MDFDESDKHQKSFSGLYSDVESQNEIVELKEALRKAVTKNEMHQSFTAFSKINYPKV